MSRRKDQERFQRLKAQDSRYQGFRGPNTQVAKPAEELETAICSVCNRMRNVSVTTLPDDRASFVCLGCQQERAAAASS
jgi:hypothetical protein